MSKKHFIALADAVRRIRPVHLPGELERFAGRLDMWKNTVNELADFCQSQNSNFMRDRWLMYVNGECGKNGGKAGTEKLAPRYSASGKRTDRGTR